MLQTEVYSKFKNNKKRINISIGFSELTNLKLTIEIPVLKGFNI